ncbi:DUF1330 domain-containing protein [Neisseria chenwenguii]|uniref:DUF1330 domain-containing protein n=1 Tax=Neisseria chenwenguii TaxID=1853278 RepID=A0A220S377_9NEIS|nr:DUF1330 domain-containing protein [Neisseria chenwenguii]ASK27877.1 hypothetical protein BG910_09150 [Neisseria chenwenguii]ROV56268.1 DUF1330 domain-containing protein [Neisseria chenwenguii]
MSAYVIFLRDQMLDQSEYDRYLQLAAPSLTNYNGEMLVLNGAIQALEGAPADGSVVIRFPDMATARAWYNSPEYAPYRDIRINATIGRAVLVNGL